MGGQVAMIFRRNKRTSAISGGSVRTLAEGMMLEICFMRSVAHHPSPSQFAFACVFVYFPACGMVLICNAALLLSPRSPLHQMKPFNRHSPRGSNACLCHCKQPLPQRQTQLVFHGWLKKCPPPNCSISLETSRLQWIGAGGTFYLTLT